MANRGVCSDWLRLETRMEEFMGEVEEGDMLDFDRFFYTHQAIYMGKCRVGGGLQACVGEIQMEAEKQVKGTVSWEFRWDQSKALFKGFHRPL